MYIRKYLYIHTYVHGTAYKHKYIIRKNLLKILSYLKLSKNYPLVISSEYTITNVCVHTYCTYVMCCTVYGLSFVLMVCSSNPFGLFKFSKCLFILNFAVDIDFTKF